MTKKTRRVNPENRVRSFRRWTAAELVNQLPESDLARVLHEYGEERYARRIARVYADGGGTLILGKILWKLGVRP